MGGLFRVVREKEAVRAEQHQLADGADCSLFRHNIPGPRLICQILYNFSLMCSVFLKFLSTHFFRLMSIYILRYFFKILTDYRASTGTSTLNSTNRYRYQVRFSFSKIHVSESGSELF